MNLPLTISNIHGETLIFKSYNKNEKGEDIIIVENELEPNAGPPMHVHFKQDESLTVQEGVMAYQTLGKKIEYAKKGETVTFHAGTPHKFWNAGNNKLKCKGWISPPNTIVYFLSEIYKSTNENNGRPSTFDAAYLLHRYRHEYNMYDIPLFVKNIIFPISRILGTLAGKHKKYKDAPMPV